MDRYDDAGAEASQLLERWIGELAKGTPVLTVGELGRRLAALETPSRLVVKEFARGRAQLMDKLLVEPTRTDCCAKARELSRRLDVELGRVLDAQAQALAGAPPSAREALLERQASFGRMAAGFAHVVRNPLNSAKLQLALARRRGRTVDAAGTLAAIEQAEAEVLRLERLTSDFVAFAQPRALVIAPVELRALAAAVVATHAAAATTAGVELRDLSEDLPVLQADRVRLEQALGHLVRNALEATPRGGHVTVRAHRAPGRAEIEVSDDGPGIPTGAPVFEAFYSTKDFGTGLGLSIVQRIARDHDGGVGVHSQPGATSVTLWLPLPAPVSTV